MEAHALVGRTLGPYEVEDVIGRGGAGVVYRALDREGHRTVALKTVSGGPDQVAAVADLVGEARWLTRCRAPHIVQVFDVGRIDGVSFIAMELMASTLEARVAEGPAPLADLIGIGSGMLLGLDAAHQEGILHGDIKPANVGISARGTVKLLDFGVARPLPGGLRDRPGDTADRFLFSLVGTVPYMAPEQLRGGVVDERADVYGVGAVLYELATGRRPFTEGRLVPLIDEILHAIPVRPSRLNPAIEPATEDLLLTALARNPADRFQSAHEMLEGLLQTAMLTARTVVDAAMPELAQQLAG